MNECKMQAVTYGDLMSCVDFIIRINVMCCEVAFEVAMFFEV